MDYQWTKTGLKGLYIDGHEWEDVVDYCQKVFLPGLKNFHDHTRNWNWENQLDQPLPLPSERHVVVWYHNESTFYTNNQCKSRWVHSSETAILYAKGEGPLQMVADVVSANYGWLCSPDGIEAAHVFFMAGKTKRVTFRV